MRNDLSPSDLAGLEYQHARFDELHSFIGDRRVSRHEQHEDGDVIAGLRWAIVLVLTIATAVAGFAWAVQ